MSNCTPSSTDLPDPARPEPALNRAEADALLERIDSLAQERLRSTAPARAALDQARLQQRSVLGFVRETFEERGVCFMRADDTDQVGLLLKDALETASLLLSLEGRYLEDERWTMIQGLLESLGDSLYDTLEDRVWLAAQVAEMDGDSLHSFSSRQEAA